MRCFCPSRGRVVLVPGMEVVGVGSKRSGCSALVLLLLLLVVRNQPTVVPQHGPVCPYHEVMRDPWATHGLIPSCHE